MQKDITVRLLHVFPDGTEEVLFEKTLDLTPEGPWQDNVTLGTSLPAPELKLTVIDNTGREVLSYTPIVSLQGTDYVMDWDVWVYPTDFALPTPDNVAFADFPTEFHSN